jgi:hypothetical protein
MPSAHDAPPTQFPIERHFDLAWLAPLRERLLEAPDPGDPGEPGMRRLGEALSRRLLELGRDHLIVAAPLERPVPLDAALCTAPADLRVFPLLPLAPAPAFAWDPPPAIRAWLGLGAWICGEAGWNAELQRAEVPLLLPLARMRTRHARRFLSIAA